MNVLLSYLFIYFTKHSKFNVEFIFLSHLYKCTFFLIESEFYIII